jgi:hypothetical protein
MKQGVSTIKNEKTKKQYQFFVKWYLLPFWIHMYVEGELFFEIVEKRKADSERKD